MNEKYIYIIGLIAGVFLFLSAYNVMAITTPSIHASSTAFASATSLTYSITGSYTTDTNATIIVFYSDNNGGDTDYRVTYAGADLTGGGGGVVYGNHFWAYLHATSTSSFNGTKNVVVSETITARNIHSTAIIITGTDTTGIPTSASSTAGRASGLFQNNLTTDVDELLIDNVFTVTSGVFTSVGSNQIIKTSYTSGNGSTIGTQKTATSTGNVTMWEIADGPDAGSAVTFSLKGISEVAALPPSITSDFIIFE